MSELTKKIRRIATLCLMPFWRLFFAALASKGHRSYRVGRVHAVVYALDCAMHGAVNLWTPWTGYLCWHPSTIPSGRSVWPWYLYVSPNATPWGATFAAGPGVDLDEKCAARMRRARLGLVYDADMSYAAIKNAGMTCDRVEE